MQILEENHLFNFFKPDSPFVRFLDFLGNLMLLNLIYLATCLPVITIGAASAALYDVCFQLGTQEEHGIVRPFYQTFIKHFKQSTIIWCAFLLLCADLAATVWLTAAQPSSLRYMGYTALVLLLWASVIMGYIYPLLSQAPTLLTPLLKTAVFLSVGYLPQSICILLINCLPLFLILFIPAVFMKISFFIIVLYFASAAYIITRLLKKPLSTVASFR